MSLIKYSSRTPGQRHQIRLKNPVNIKFNLRQLQTKLIQHAGRNFSGQITVRGRGSGNKNNYRIIDFKRNLWNIPAIVRHFVYDPNRSAYLMLLVYNNGLVSYQIAIKDVKIGQIIQNGPKASISNGNSLPLLYIPTGIPISLIETHFGSGASLCRSAGSYATIIKKDINTGLAIILLKSGIYKGVPLTCMATIGQIANLDHQNKVLGKAGVARWKGQRPITRGVAKNPIDHPHGGGHGKTSGGRPSVTPQGRPTKGAKTRTKGFNIFHQIKLL